MTSLGTSLCRIPEWVLGILLPNPAPISPNPHLAPRSPSLPYPDALSRHVLLLEVYLLSGVIKDIEFDVVLKNRWGTMTGRCMLSSVSTL